MSLGRNQRYGIENSPVSIPLVSKSMEAISIALDLKAIDGTVNHGQINSSCSLANSKLVYEDRVRFGCVLDLQEISQRLPDIKIAQHRTL